MVRLALSAAGGQTRFTSSNLFRGAWGVVDCTLLVAAFAGVWFGPDYLDATADYVVDDRPVGNVCSGVSPSTVGGDAGSAQGAGDAPAERRGTTPVQQHPILRVHEGGREPLKGREVMENIGAYVTHCLPDLADDDPFRLALIALRHAGGCRRRESRARLEAL